jgi:hypothetical protein
MSVWVFLVLLIGVSLGVLSLLKGGNTRKMSEYTDAYRNKGKIGFCRRIFPDK